MDENRYMDLVVERDEKFRAGFVRSVKIFAQPSFFLFGGGF